MRWQIFKLHLIFTLSTTSRNIFLHIYWWRRYFFFRIWSHFCFLCDCVATSSPSSPLHNGSLPATSSDWPVSGYSSSFSLSFSDGDSSGTHLQYPPLLCGPAETPLIQIGALTKHLASLLIPCLTWPAVDLLTPCHTSVVPSSVLWNSLTDTSSTVCSYLTKPTKKIHLVLIRTHAVCLCSFRLIFTKNADLFLCENIIYLAC